MSRKQVGLTLAAVVVLAALVFFLPRLFTRHADLRTRLASALNLPKERAADFFINLPPAASRYPGTILATEQLFILNPADANDPDLHTGDSFQLTANDEVAGNALGSLGVPWLNEAASSKQEVGLELEVSDGKILEMDVPALKKKLLASQEAQSAANKGTDPIVITRSYVGKITYVLKRKGSDQGSLWQKAPKSNQDSEHFRIDASRTQEGEIRVEMLDPVIFAFEASSAHFILTHLGVEPTDVNLTPIRPHTQTVSSTSPAPAKPGTNWTLVTIASGHYPKLVTLRQDWNADSARLVDSALSQYGPVATMDLISTEQQPLTEQGVKGFVAQVTSAVQANHSKFLVAYYVGHSMTWPSGDIALILGSATEIPRNLSTRSPELLDRSVGSNIGDLARLANALDANLETLPQGFLPLRELYAELTQAHVPFALIVDGCLRMDEFERMRSELGIVSDKGLNVFFFAGSNGDPGSALSRLGDLQEHVADSQPYLHSTNLVLLAAKPGTYAMSRPNPDNTWSEVGPLAARLTNLYRASRFDADRPTLGDLIGRITDFNGVGEISATGSISWSDAAQLKQLTQTVPYPGS
ncbi:hypothetical protein HNQ77_002290 [Silvibacterium bohemicum]|uniref:Uncharacterized protein n=1 Tax=Silvibacterium bohemicum TaxID=1577686 RepID=A0A841K103_9BACT|nr:hypothetical protein [Silvibacterium bohemicum]MBB6144338.1 hypothetical protein [Silvibacterium bohemicum]